MKGGGDGKPEVILMEIVCHDGKSRDHDKILKVVGPLPRSHSGVSVSRFSSGVCLAPSSQRYGHTYLYNPFIRVSV